MNTLHLPVTEGHKWAKRNLDTDLLEFFTCVDSGYFKQEDYTLVTDEYMEQYIEENYPKEEPLEEEQGNTPDASAMATDASTL